jgi:phosphoserine aminotransferase
MRFVYSCFPAISIADQKQAKKYLQPHIAASSESSRFTSIPAQSSWTFSSDAAYVYYCGNETIHGMCVLAEQTFLSVPTAFSI